jgi:hypothetical protein
MKSVKELNKMFEEEDENLLSDKSITISTGTKIAMKAHTEKSRAGGKTWKGKTRGDFTKDHKIKLSKARLGKKLSEEHCEHLSEALKGKPKSEEHKKALSLKASNMSDEHRRKLSEAAKNRGKKV